MAHLLGKESGMLLYEARNMIENMQTNIPKGMDAYEALELAKKCMEAQEGLTELLNDLQTDFREGDCYSAKLAAEMLCSVSIFGNEMRENFGLDPEDGDDYEKDLDESDE